MLPHRGGRYSVTQEDHPRVMELLQASGGRLDSSLDGLLTPLTGARSPRLPCSRDTVGLYLLVSVRPRQADLLGDDARPMCGLTRTPVAPAAGTAGTLGALIQAAPWGAG